MATYRKTIWMDMETWGAVQAYRDEHPGKFKSQSAAMVHLIRRALAADLSEDTEAVVAPFLADQIYTNVNGAVIDFVVPLIKAQTKQILERLPPAPPARRPGRT